MDKTCLECGENVRGRIDKKFCSDACRNSYNNRNNSDTNNLVRNINNILRKNRRILKALNPKGKRVVSKTDLLDRGYNFEYHTNTYHTKSGNLYYFCYEQGYLELEDNRYSLVIKQEYM